MTNEYRILIAAIALLLISIVVISLFALFRNKDIIDILRLPWGIKWKFWARSPRQDKVEPETKGINWGKKNRFEGEIGDVSSGNMTKGVKPTPSTLTPKKTGGIDWGTENKFKKNIGDVSSGDMTKSDEK